VPAHDAVRYRGEHQFPQPRELFRRNIRPALVDGGNGLVNDPPGELCLYEACQRDLEE